jgi:preprotein translocase subunit SecA
MTEITLPALMRHPERALPRDSAWTRLTVAADAALRARATRRRAAGLAGVVGIAERLGPALRSHSDGRLREEAAAVGADLRARPQWLDDELGRAFAVVREAAARSLGQRPYDVQLQGAHAVLRGMAAEMATGEGKTLAAGIAAAVAGLAGVPVHLVTVNGYLAERDAAAMLPLYAMLGLTCGVVTDAVPPAARRAAYRCDITVCTGQELAFDYMRDRLRAGRRTGELRSRVAGLVRHAGQPQDGLLRGLHFAIVDEADSVLIDEARTPLVLAVETSAERDTAIYDRALSVAADMRPGEGFRLFANERRIALLPEGRDRLQGLAAEGLPWDEPAERERLVTLALTALHTLHRDEHYLLEDGKAGIIDEFTGRIMPDRTWSDGLQEMVDRKEGLALSPNRTTQARMTYQRFFRRYRRLAGLSGTLSEVAGELWTTYNLRVATIPTHRPDRKAVLPTQGHASEADKWRAIAASVARMHQSGSPVLIGTRTVGASELASRALTQAGLAHAVLSAAQPSEEADIIAHAGQPGAITVATNMAGRGTDIRLGAGIDAMGGLHVVISEPHEARRIDRQLAGRCGRQGDPGAVASHVSLDDAVLQRHCPGPALRLAGWRGLPGRGRWVLALSRLAQRRAERLHARMRRDLLRSDEWLGDALAFAGEAE